MKTAGARILRALLPLAVAAIASLAGCDAGRNLTDADHLARARELRAKNDDKGATVEIRNALQKNPKNTDARVLLAEIYVDAGGGKQAQNELEIALQRGAQRVKVKLPMARAYLLQGSFDAAAREAQVDLSTLGGDRAGLMEVEGRARIAMRQYDRGCALFDEARKTDPGLMAAYYGSATCAAVKGNSDEARAIIDQALNFKPDVSQSWVLLGDINRVDHKLDVAEQQYTKALSLKKNNVDALLGRALTHIEQRKLPETEADLAEIEKFSKGNALASYISGIVRFRQGRFPEAKGAFETTLTTAPTHFPSILWLGLTNFEQRNYESAATQLNQFVTLQPNAVKVKALLALARARLGGVKQVKVDLGELAKYDIDDPQTLAMIGEVHTYLGNPSIGTQFLTRAVDLNPDELPNRVNLAKLLLEQDDVAGAIKELNTVLSMRPDYTPAMAILIKALIRQKNFDAAMAQAQALVTREPNNPLGLDFVGSIQLAMGDEAAARTTFGKLLESHPKFFPATNNLALLAIKKGDFAGAEGYYQKALAADPNSLSAMLGLHSVERSMNRSAEAEKVLVQATKAYPTEVLPAQLLAQSHLAARRPRQALNVTEEAARAHPEDAGLLEARGLAYMALNEPASAIVAFNKLAQQRNDAAMSFVYVASALKALGDKPGRRAALATAMKLEPANLRARLDQGVMLVDDGKYAEAIAIAKAMQRDATDQPDGYVLEASASAAAGKPRDALRVLTETVQRFPASMTAHVALARVQSTMGDLPGMIAGLEQWRKADPVSPLAVEALGEAYVRSGREAEALAAYKAQLVLQPDDVRALNNVAFLSRASAPDQAVSLAGRALQLDPNNPVVYSTLGQIQLERGDLEAALKAFARANELAPKDARIRYRLATTLAKSGKTAQARRELERLLAASPSFEGAADARALLSQLSRS